MVVLERKLSGILRYRMVFFPTAAVVRQMTEHLGLTSMARLFSTDVEIEKARHLVSHDITATTCVDLTQNIDAIFRAMQASTRNKIRKAEKLDVRVAVERNGPQAIDDFLDLYADLAREKNGQVLQVERGVLGRYASCSDIFLARLDGAVICGHVNLRDEQGQRQRLLYSANRRFDDHDSARLSGILNHYLHWQEMRIYQEEGFRTYDFGGISRNGDPHAAGIDRFKLSFGGATVIEHNYLCAGLPMLGRAALRLFGYGHNR
jgi:lipid II:glycine glycyltransferase (peptidoglycan interpeptide bridge formation enzyme)